MDLFSRLAVTAVAAVVLWILWRASRPRPVFEVQLREGNAEVRSGKVTQAFLGQLREVLTSHNVKKATVQGIGRGRLIALKFSSEVPAPACQQLRNWWMMSGWSLGPRERRMA